MSELAKLVLPLDLSLAARLREVEEENLRLKVTAANLRRRVYHARHRQALWLLRQQAWRAERDDLLRRLARRSP